VRIPAFEVCVI